MNPRISPIAGQPATHAPLLDVSALLAAYVDLRPDPAVAAQRVAFGTSGHRGVAFARSFNEWHILATTQAICDYRRANGIDGPLYLGIDTHALSQPAFESALSVLAGNGVTTMIAKGGEYTPTPAISHAILSWNRGRSSGLADGIVITPSHNPPEHGGLKYNPTSGGGAASSVTTWIEQRANALLEAGLKSLHYLPFTQARCAASTHEHNYLENYVADLAAVIDFEAIRSAAVRMSVDPLGGAGVHYWARIAERYRLDLAVISERIDPTFAFMSLDWDGQIRMDPSSSWTMQGLIALKDRFDIGFACDTDHDRHGIVTPGTGLLSANHYLCVMIDYLFRQRPQWSAGLGVGKTMVSSALIDRVAARLGRAVHEVPPGFKWFVDGLQQGALGFAGEESAGATFNRIDGAVWTTDKDGISAALLAAEITARCGRDPGALYAKLARDLGEPHNDRVDAPASVAQKARLGRLRADQIACSELAGEPVLNVLDRAPGNGAALGGIKVSTANGWFAARPSGTENIYKIYAESFRDDTHLKAILAQAQQIVDAAIGEA